ncbi:MAG TPA: hypothetical protein VNO30_22935 [Kofleriaceae bacterium]|nr:hypothetical protein [Kofleriaceae bacterium]
MRRVTPWLLLAMMLALVTLMWIQREGDAAPSPPPADKTATKPGDPAAGKPASDKPAPGTPAAGTPAAGKPAPGTPAAGKPAPDKPAPGQLAEKPDEPPARPPLRRPLRTVALGWELLAPGIVAGDGAYKAAGLEASFTHAASMEDVESALAKGGEAGGADLAIVPLASYVASYERLRALSPEVAFVVGWSRGREALFAADAQMLARPPAAGDVKLAATTPTGPETFFALFLLDLAGVPASRVSIVERGATLTAVRRGGQPRPAGKLLVTSADTPRLLPIVAVAPHGFIEAHGAELESWARVWLAGVGKLAGDVPAGGRLVAAMNGAPPVLGIIEALGQVEFASLRENAAAAGLSGRGALTTGELFRTAWRIWREAGVLTTPAPEAAPLYTGAVAALVRADPAAAAEVPRARPPAEEGARPAVLLVARAPLAKDGTVDTEAFVARIGFVAGVFDRLALRVAVRDDAKAAKLLTDLARDRFGLRPTQLSLARRPPANLPGAIEVLSAM